MTRKLPQITWYWYSGKTVMFKEKWRHVVKNEIIGDVLRSKLRMLDVNVAISRPILVASCCGLLLMRKRTPPVACTPQKGILANFYYNLGYVDWSNCLQCHFFAIFCAHVHHMHFETRMFKITPKLSLMQWENIFINLFKPHCLTFIQNLEE